ncbi:TetR/AcrR family transcriptional regulator [Rhodospirillaceae bacterium SYSU D60014]|uniref:TetR/AcrR family transcriptional regulator n=1 Tax=Virgifigura deserti TaxID=2268457 RepID=UPI000E65F6F7
MNEETARRRGRPSSKERALDAALEIVLESGAGHLTFEALAEKSGISRGGLLYNFPSKQALLKDLVRRYIEQCRQEIDAIEADRPPTLNSAIRKLVEQRLSSPPHDRRAAGSMLAAMAEDPALVEPVREHHEELANEIRATSERPDLAFVAWMALEGLFFQELFGLSPMSSEERVSLIERIRELADPPRPSP